MIARARAKEGVEDVAITTNGLLFARRAKELVEAGLNRVNISLDALTPEVFARITRGGKVERVLEAAKEAVWCWVREGLPPCAGRFNGLDLSLG